MNETKSGRQLQIAFLFPGQGSQYVGMGKNFCERFLLAREMYGRASEILGWDVARLSFEGPMEKLTQTCHTQPAVLVHSYIAFRLLEERGVRPAMALGHSLGEYSALVAAGAADFEAALRLVQARGRFMHEAVPSGGGAMAALLGAEREVAEAVCREVDGVVEVANYNGAGQYVLSGEKKAVEAAAALAEVRGTRKVVMLPVGAPFHCSLLTEAADQMSEVLDGVEFRPLSVPVYANVTGKPVRDAAEAKDLLRRQIRSSVRWEDAMRSAGEAKPDAVVEVGPGKVLSGLSRRILREVPAWNVEDGESLEKTVLGLGQLA
ncbi:MAG: [acyl-carrier-protein] S-malonyltransferase [Candidatus Tectomicrobia bacterium RIFCSPLOWO2_12_FULL_69_37]|nr:MAG: [acyl-carrier-protein] S-malonyltransferase [Candidatus Tectomicrobia bacterium RIFCSPLOWO2_12_FULL_69_37]OGL63481.1 MAG: [acyl-carrier-protein] S-malonyltransferase [Candidatus Tectomicrobia bacterium RIFCSPLOWO2_02_FULL_70_19]